MGEMQKLTETEKAQIYGDRTGLPDNLPHCPPDTEWIGSYMIGEGGQGMVTVWCCVDKKTQKTVNQIVIKDSLIGDRVSEPKYYQGVYEDMVRKGLDWGADTERQPGMARPAERYFREAYLQSIMTEPASSGLDIKAVPMYGYLKKGSKGTLTHWRLYMPFYQHSTLAHIILAHLRAKRAIPEPFIWHIFKCLTEGARQLETQARERPHADGNIDDVIVALDMKPLNVLMTPPRGDQFAIYPGAHIADLGGGHLTHMADPKNVGNTLAMTQTPGFVAPEQSIYLDPYGVKRKARPDPLHSWTNVWQVGRIIEAMIRCQVAMPDLPYFNPSINEDAKEPNIRAWPPRPYGMTYSDELIRLTWECMRYRPSLRPSPERVLDYINEEAPKHYQDMDIWGTPAWIEREKQEQERKRANDEADRLRKIEHDRAKAMEEGRPFTEPTPEEPTAEEVRAARQKKYDRWFSTMPYTLAWPERQRDEYWQLNHHVPKDLEIEWSKKKLQTFHLFTTGQELRNPDGTLKWPLPYHDEDGQIRPLTVKLKEEEIRNMARNLNIRSRPRKQRERVDMGRTSRVRKR